MVCPAGQSKFQPTRPGPTPGDPDPTPILAPIQTPLHGGISGLRHPEPALLTQGTLALFRVRSSTCKSQSTGPSWHLVFPVSNRSRLEGRMPRMTINGWLATTNASLRQYWRVKDAGQPRVSAEACGWGKPDGPPHPGAADNYASAAAAALPWEPDAG